MLLQCGMVSLMPINRRKKSGRLLSSEVLRHNDPDFDSCGLIKVRLRDDAHLTLE